jgi:tetratricopeptide (TPR) repeat protein
VRGRLTEAESLYEQTLDIFRRLEDGPWVVVCLNNLALVALKRADYDRALTRATEAVKLARSIGNAWGLAIALRYVGDVALTRRGHQLAAQCFSESLTIGQANQIEWAIADGLAAFGSLLVSQGIPERGVRFFATASAIYDVIGVRMPPRMRPDWKEAIRTARSQLGTAKFNKVWQSGGSVSVDQAIDEALNQGRQTRNGAID